MSVDFGAVVAAAQPDDGVTPTSVDVVGVTRVVGAAFGDVDDPQPAAPDTTKPNVVAKDTPRFNAPIMASPGRGTKQPGKHQLGCFDVGCTRAKGLLHAGDAKARPRVPRSFDHIELGQLATVAPRTKFDFF